MCFCVFVYLYLYWYLDPQGTFGASHNNIAMSTFANNTMCAFVSAVHCNDALYASKCQGNEQ